MQLMGELLHWKERWINIPVLLMLFHKYVPIILIFKLEKLEFITPTFVTYIQSLIKDSFKLSVFTHRSKLRDHYYAYPPLALMI